MATIENRGIVISYEDSGAGLPLVLIHSFLCSRKMWEEQVPVLAKSYRVINVDFRGHGESGKIKHTFSLHHAVSDIVAVLDELGIQKAIWCGLSIGGMVAMRAALICPKRVHGLILLGTDAGAEVSSRKLRNYLMGFGAKILGIRPFLSSIATLMFGETTRRQNPELVRQWQVEFSRVHVPSMLFCLKALTRRRPVIKQLEYIKCPTLVLVGNEDRALPPVLSYRIHKLLHDSELVQIPDAGHLSTLEKPQEVNNAIWDFLKRRYA